MRGGITYLPEDRKVQGLFPVLSVGYNISITFLRKILRGWGVVDTKEERKRGESYIRRLAIKTPSLQSKVYSLSGGNQQKVVIARSMGSSTVQRLRKANVITLHSDAKTVEEALSAYREGRLVELTPGCCAH